MAKRMTIMISCLIIIFGIIFGWHLFGQYMFKKYMASYVPPPVSINAVHASNEDWHPSLESVGSLSPINGVDITSEAAGKVTHIYFKSGQMVTKGDLLVTLDTSVEEADLSNFEAQLKLANSDYKRVNTLFKRGVGSAQSVDQNSAKVREAKANVASTKAKINLKTIRAPFSGKLGIDKINTGQFLAAGTAMVNLQALDNLYVHFSLPATDISKLYPGQDIQVTVDAYDKQVFKGKITAINSEVDTNTRNIQIQAVIPNLQHKLLPGMSAIVKVILPEQNNVVTLPQTAITYTLYGDSVFIIKPGKKDKKGKATLIATRSTVKVGQRRGDQVAIISGVKAGDLVVSSGQLKLQNHANVSIAKTGS